MDIIEFTNKLKINNDIFKSNSILFFLGNFDLDNFNIKKIIKKPLSTYLTGGGDGKGNGKINNLEEIEKYNDKPVNEFINIILNTNPEYFEDKIILCNIIIVFYKNIYIELGYQTYKESVFVKIL